MLPTPPTQTFSQNERIINKGDTAKAAYQIKQGVAHVFLDKDDKIVTLATLQKGAIFGEMALYTGKEYSANVEAAEDNTILELITPSILKNKLSQTDPFVKKMLDALIERLQNTNSALLESETRDFIEIDLI